MSLINPIYALNDTEELDNHLRKSFYKSQEELETWLKDFITPILVKLEYPSQENHLSVLEADFVSQLLEQVLKFGLQDGDEHKHITYDGYLEEESPCPTF